MAERAGLPEEPGRESRTEPGEEPGARERPNPGLREIVLAASLALAATLLVYAPALRSGLCGEDWIWLYEAWQTHGPGDLFQARSWPFVRPVCAAWNALLWHCFGLTPLGWHAASLLLHALTALLLYALLRRLGVDRPASGLALLVFVAWPPSWEAVTWISASGEIVKTLLVAATLLAFVAWRGSPCPLRYGLALLLAALACLAKESAVVLPALLLLADRLLPPRPSLLRALWRALPFAAVAAAIYGLEHLAVRATHPHAFYDLNAPFTARFASGLLHLVASGSGLPALPLPLPRGQAALWAWIAFAGLALAAARRAPRAVLFATMIPLSYVPAALVVPDFIPADRYGYTASLALACLVGLALQASARPRNRPGLSALTRSLALLVAAIACIGMGLRLHAHVTDTSRQIASRAIRPDSVKQALKGLGPLGHSFVFAPPPGEHFPSFAVALAARLPATRVRDWYEARQGDGPVLGDVMLYYDEQDGTLVDLTDPLRGVLKAFRARPATPGQAPSDASSGRPAELRSWTFIDPAERSSWHAVGLDNSEGTAMYHTRGYPGHLFAPHLDLNPMEVGSVQIDVRVHGRRDPGATLILAWTSEQSGGFGPERWLEVPLPGVEEGWRSLHVYPCNRPSWWLEPVIRGLYLVPSTTPTTVEIRTIRILAPGRRPQTPPR